MNKVIFLFSFTMLSASVFGQTPKIPVGAQMQFNAIVIDYGDIPQGSDGNREFVFTNVGTAPLEISNATSSCGCVIPIWPKEPIAPGDKNVIKVHYDTNREGKFTKYVTLSTNAPDQESFRLTIKGNVIPKADANGASPAGH